MQTGNEWIRTELLIGTEGVKTLRESTVAVFGVGGVGSHCIEALARSGIGHFILVDHDQVSESNINRQSIALHNTIGMQKTQVMKQKIAQIAPETKVETFETFVLTENIKEIFDQAGVIDYIVDAIDTVTAKLSIVCYAREHNIPLISSMGTGNKLHPELFKIADISETSVCPLCKVMRKELKHRGIDHLKVVYSEEKPLKPKVELPKEETGVRRSTPGSISFVPPVAGLLIAGEVVRSLIGIE